MHSYTLLNPAARLHQFTQPQGYTSSWSYTHPRSCTQALKYTPLWRLTSPKDYIQLWNYTHSHGATPCQGATTQRGTNPIRGATLTRGATQPPASTQPRSYTLSTRGTAPNPEATHRLRATSISGPTPSYLAIPSCRTTPTREVTLRHGATPSHGGATLSHDDIQPRGYTH